MEILSPDASRADASVLPADVDAALLSEQDVGHLSAVQLQVVLHVPARGAAALLRPLPLRRVVPGERHLEVAQDAAGDEALQLLPGRGWKKRGRNLAPGSSRR